MRSLLLLAALAVVTGELRAQAGAPVPVRAHSFGERRTLFRVDLPLNWTIVTEEDGLLAHHDDAVIMVFANDVVASQGIEVDSASEASTRRAITELALESDSLLIELAEDMLASFGGDLGAVTQEYRGLTTLAGQKSVHIVANVVGEPEDHEPDGEPVSMRMEVFFTVKGAVIYLLLYGAPLYDFPEHEPLFARARSSLQLVD